MPDCYVRPLFVVGDSHSGPLNGLLLRDAAGEPVAFGEAWCVHGLSARTALDAAGAVHPGVVAALAGLHLLRSLAGADDTLPYLQLGDRFFSASWIAPTTAVLFVAGELDAREIIASIPLDAEPALPFPVNLSRLPAPGSGPELPAAILQERILATFRPLFAMMQRLEHLGLTRLALASLPPPNADDDEYFRITGIRSRARTRYVVHLAVNMLFRTFCARHEAPFVDVWDDLTDGNVANPKLFVDGLHYGYAGARATLRAFHSLAFAARAS